HERQQFLDRYFVFTSDWKPPKDYSRTNGLLEVVRQAFTEVDEREQLEREGLPEEEKTHEPSSPLELSGDVKPGKGGKKASKKRKKRSDNAAAPLRVQPLARTLNFEAVAPRPGPEAAIRAEAVQD